MSLKVSAAALLAALLVLGLAASTAHAVDVVVSRRGEMQRAEGLFDDIEDKVNDIKKKASDILDSLKASLDRAKELPDKLNVLSDIKNKADTIGTSLGGLGDSIGKLDMGATFRKWRGSVTAKLNSWEDKIDNLVGNFSDAHPKITAAFDSVKDAVEDAGEAAVKFGKAMTGKCTSEEKQRAEDFFNTMSDLMQKKRKDHGNIALCITNLILDMLKVNRIKPEMLPKKRTSGGSKASAQLHRAPALPQQQYQHQHQQRLTPRFAEAMAMASNETSGGTSGADAASNTTTTGGTTSSNTTASGSGSASGTSATSSSGSVESTSSDEAKITMFDQFCLWFDYCGYMTYMISSGIMAWNSANDEAVTLTAQLALSDIASALYASSYSVRSMGFAFGCSY